MADNKDALKGSLSRRDFIKTSAAVTAALAASGNYAFAQGGGKLKVGLIGCGGRGSGAAAQNIMFNKDVELYAMGDLFADRLNGARGALKGEFTNAKVADRMTVTDDRCFTGFDAYKKVLASGVDLVILATPPGFRPIHFAAAIEAGKHVFMEKPVAVDAHGVNMVIAAAKLAKQKKLGVVAGTQRRHQLVYVETMKRLNDGAIGDIVAAQCYWNQGGLWKHDRQPNESDMEWQIRNWLYLAWLSGDHIVEQHVHNLDVINWAMGGPPKTAYGMGGREVRKDPSYGHIFDHFTIEFEYPNGGRLMSMCRQIDGTDGNVSEFVIGTKGRSNCAGWIDGANKWNFSGEEPMGGPDGKRRIGPYEQEHVDLVNSIRSGNPLNEGERIAYSTATAIMGRLSAYTGKRVDMDTMLKSDFKITPDTFEFGKIDVPPVAVPGQTKLPWA